MIGFRSMLQKYKNHKLKASIFAKTVDRKMFVLIDRPKCFTMFYLRKEKSSVVYCKSTIYRGFDVPEAGLEPARL